MIPMIRPVLLELLLFFLAVVVVADELAGVVDEPDDVAELDAVADTGTARANDGTAPLGST